MIAIIVFADFSLHYVIVDLSLSPGFHCNLLTVIFWLLELSIFSNFLCHYFRSCLRHSCNSIIVITSSNALSLFKLLLCKIKLNEATKWYFTHYSCVVIILLDTGLCRTEFSTISTVFHISVFSVFFVLNQFWINFFCFVFFSIYKNSPYKYQTIYLFISILRWKQTFREVLSSSKNFIYKGKCGTIKKWKKVKKFITK